MPDTVEPRRRPRIALLYARDDRHLGGGSDTRVAVLRAALHATADVDDVLLPSSERTGSGPSRYLAALYGVPPRISQQLDLGLRRRIAPRLAAADLIVATTTFSLPYVARGLRPRTVLDAHNVESEVVRQLAERSSSPLRRLAYRLTAAWTAAWERRAVRGLAQVWAVSAPEAQWFQDGGATRVAVVPNGVHLPPARTTEVSAPVVVFVASFTSVFNQEALGWFLGSVWPLVLEAVPQARLVLAGRGSEGTAGRHVEGRGFVPDLTAVYGGARVAIAPLRSGAGTRLKVVEGLAHGVPVVATTIGAEGLDLEAGRDYLRADTPDAFAAACVSLLVDDALWHGVRDRGRAGVERAYDWEAIGREAAAAASHLCRTT